MTQCPSCRGDLVYDTANQKWFVTFATPTSIADGLDLGTFELSALLDDNTPVNESLDEVEGVEVGNETEFSWTLDSFGTPLSGSISVDHDPNGNLEQSLTVSEQGAAA